MNKKDSKTNLFNTGLQFLKFSSVGFINVIITLCIYYAGLWIGINYLVSYIVGYIFGIFNAFFWNDRYVFRGEKDNNKINAFTKMACSYTLSILFSTALIWILVGKIGMTKLMSPIIKICITAPLNFLVNKYWAFKKGELSFEKTISKGQNTNE